MPSYKKISDLSAGTALDGSETFEAVQSSNSVKITGTQIQTFARGGAGISGATLITGYYILDNDSELDYSSSITNAQTSAVTTITELPSTTKAILCYFNLGDTGTTPRVGFRVSASSSIETIVGASFADVGVNSIQSTQWLRTDGNTVYVTRCVADSVKIWNILGYMIG